MVKLVVMYGRPKDPAAFDTYYAEKHLPIASRMEGIARKEKAQVLMSLEGSEPSYWRMTEMYFDSMEQLRATMESPAGRAATDDWANFATGGVTTLICAVE